MSEVPESSSTTGGGGGGGDDRVLAEGEASVSRDDADDDNNNKNTDVAKEGQIVDQLGDDSLVKTRTASEHNNKDEEIDQQGSMPIAGGGGGGRPTPVKGSISNDYTQPQHTLLDETAVKPDRNPVEAASASTAASSNDRIKTDNSSSTHSSSSPPAVSSTPQGQDPEVETITQGRKSGDEDGARNGPLTRDAMKGSGNNDTVAVPSNPAGSSKSQGKIDSSSSSSSSSPSPSITPANTTDTRVTQQSSSTPKQDLTAQNVSTQSLTGKIPQAPPPSSGEDDDDEEKLKDRSVRQQRRQFEARYGPFIVDSDTSLEAARKRLISAIDQTRQLRALFTERIYDKYRVCLKPPPPTTQIVDDIKSNPKDAFHQMETTINTIGKEKDQEKIESTILNNEVAAFVKLKGDKANPLGPLNAENAEQLMYVTTGLNLVILPESDAPQQDVKYYEERSPIDPETGQRSRGINQSSAAASAVVLDRCRQAVRLKDERDRRKQQLIQAKADSSQKRAAIQNYSRLSILTTQPKNAPSGAGKIAPKSSSFKDASGLQVIPPTGKIITGLDGTQRYVKNLKDSAGTGNSRKRSTPPTQKERQAMNLANARAIRARVQASMSLNTIMSINPAHEELRTDGKISASTAAMMERGVGGYHGITSKTAPQRYSHPFPDSIGGRRPRKPPIPGRREIVDPLSLPLLPTVKDRRRATKLSVFPPNECHRSNSAGTIRRIMNQFEPDISSMQRPRKRRATNIGLMRSLTNNATSDKDQSDKDVIVNPILALNVMKAVGLINPCPGKGEGTTSPFQSSFTRPLLDSEEMKRRGVVVDSGPMGDFVSNFQRLENQFFSSSILGVASIVNKDNGLSSNPKLSQTESQSEIMHIRGGGGDDGDCPTSLIDETKVPSTDGKTGATQPNPNFAMDTKPSAVLANASSLHHGAVNGSNIINPQNGMVWDGRSQQLLQAQIAQAQAAQLHGQIRPAGNYSQASALQLANQLRLSTIPQQQANHPQARDLSEYVKGLNQSQQTQMMQNAFNWNAASTAAAAALGLNQQHQSTATPTLTVQDQAGAFLTSEQQKLAAQAAVVQQQQQQHAVAMFRSSVVSNAYGDPGYAALGASMLNSSSAMVRRDSTPQQLTPATPNQPLSALPSNSSNAAPILNNLELDIEPTPMPDVEPTPIDEKSVRIIKVNGNKDTESSSRKPVVESGDRKRKLAGEDVQSHPEPEITNKKRRSDVQDRTTNKSVASKPVSVTSRGEVSQPGLQFFAPTTPSSIRANTASLILAGKCHEAIGPLGQCESTAQGEQLVSYIKALGASVPIPDRMVSPSLKERLNAPEFKNSGVGSIPALSQGIIQAVILHWLWKTQEPVFHRAFARSGRVDTDPECKWLVKAALDKAVEAMSREVADAATRATSPLAVALLAHKNKNSDGQTGGAKTPAESLKATTTRLDLLAASIVSKALSFGVTIDEEVNSVLPHFHDLLEYLDDCRKCALFCRSQERVLLAALVARKSTMSINFSHAYVSAMVRAGEAVGHGEVFEAVQNEKVSVSTMIPYDVFTDESGAWEDPCRPALGYNENLNGDELMRRAHARAMIQKSLKKLQDRHGIKGGTPSSGPYADQPTPTTPSGGRQTPSAVTPRGRRRSSMSEPPIQPGTGSAAATSWALYDPKHISEPLERRLDTMENSPYGIFNANTRPRSLSQLQGAALMRQRGRGSITGGKDLRRQNSGRQLKSQDSLPLSSHEINVYSDGKNAQDVGGGDTGNGDGAINSGLQRSTREISWTEVAGIFQPVQSLGQTKDRSNKDKPAEKDQPVNETRTILAPIVRKVDDLPASDDDDENDSGEEEDLSDEAMLARHQVVLDRMKQRLAIVLESRQRAARSQDRRKSRGR